MTLAAGYGAVRGLQNRPAMPFNDRNFQPEHPTPVMYVHGINSRTAAFESNAHRPVSYTHLTLPTTPYV